MKEYIRKNTPLLFIMNVDWNWIKQRPHFLAEGLSQYIPTIVAYKHKYNRKGLQNRKKGDVKLFSIYTIPKVDSYDSLVWINSLIIRIILFFLIKTNHIANVVLTYPNQINYIPREAKCSIIYDCMDAHVLFAKNAKQKERIKRNELLLCKQASKIICSSEYLKKYIINNYNTKKEKVHVIRNAFDGKIINIDSKTTPNDIFCYFGTIADWFDFDFLVKSLDDCPTVEYWLYGPLAQGIEIPSNPRIKYMGTIEHDVLFEKVKDSLAFIMPFRVDDKIEAVDPVKIYEFINFNKNFIIPRYGEVERYADFGYLYSDYKSYVKSVNSIIQNRSVKYSEKERNEFLKNNTWEQRVISFLELL